MLTGCLVGAAIAAVLFAFELVSVTSSSRGRVRRRHLKKAELDQSEIARLRNLGWFCIQLPAIGAAMGWLLT